jgi:hypothetical protein
MIGGALSKDEGSIAGSLDSHESSGYIGWIDLSKEEARDSSDLSSLQEEAGKSISLAIIIPDKSMLSQVRELFPNGMVFTPEEIKGLEFSKIILFNFFSGNYPANYLKAKETLLPVLDPHNSASQNFPKNVGKVKEQGRFSELFNKLFVAITRTTSDLHFVETGTTKVTDYFYKLIDPYTGKGEQVKLEASAIKDIIEFIEEKGASLSQEHLLHYCKMGYDKIEAEILASSEASASHKYPVGNETLLDYLNGFIQVISHTENTTRKMQDFLTKTRNLLKSVQSLEDDNQKGGDSNNSHLAQSLPVEVSEVKKAPMEESPLALICSAATQPPSVTNSPSILAKSQHTTKHKGIKAKGSSPEKFHVNKLLKPEFDITTLTSLEQDIDGRSILLLLTSMPSLQTKLIAEISKNNPDFIGKITAKALYLIGPKGWAPLHYIVAEPQLKALLEKTSLSQKIFSFFSLKEAPLFPTHITNIYNSSPYEKIMTFKELLDNSEHISAAIQDKSTALHLMVRVESERAEIAKCLLQNGAKIDVTDKNGCTALHIAAQYGCVKVVKYLLEHGANIETINKNGATALGMARQWERIEIVKCLSENAITKQPNITAFNDDYTTDCNEGDAPSTDGYNDIHDGVTLLG